MTQFPDDCGDSVLDLVSASVGDGAAGQGPQRTSCFEVGVGVGGGGAGGSPAGVGGGGGALPLPNEEVWSEDQYSAFAVESFLEKVLNVG